MNQEAEIPAAALEDAQCFVRIRVTLQEACLAATMVKALQDRHGAEVWQAAMNHNGVKAAEEHQRLRNLYYRCTVQLDAHKDHWMLNAGNVPSPNGWRQIQADARAELDTARYKVAELQALQHDLDGFVDVPDKDSSQ